MVAKNYRGPNITVHITQELIDESVRRSSAHCMISEAIQAALPQMSSVSSDVQSIRFTDMERELRFVYLTPRIAQVMLVDFDQGNHPKPFAFKLGTLAAQVMAVENPERRRERDQARRALRKLPEAEREAEAKRMAEAGILRPKHPLAGPRRVGPSEGTGNVPTVLGGREPPNMGNMFKRRTFGMKMMIR